VGIGSSSPSGDFKVSGSHGGEKKIPHLVPDRLPKMDHGGEEEEHCENDRHREGRNVSVEWTEAIIVSRTGRGTVGHDGK